MNYRNVPPVVIAALFFYSTTFQSTIDTSKFHTDWRPASFALSPPVNETLGLRPLQRLNASDVPEKLLHLVNLSSFMLSENFARLATRHVARQTLTLTQWDQQEMYTTEDDRHQCIYSDCRIITSRDVPTDGYIFNLRGTTPWEDKPDLVGKWSVLTMTESPVNTRGNARKQPQLPFHVASTFRWDSEANFLYGTARLRSVPLRPLPDYSLGRSVGAIWPVSNWSGRRFGVYRKLASYISVDVMGELSWMNFPRRSIFWNSLCKSENDEYGDCISDNNRRDCKLQETAYVSCMGRYSSGHHFYLAFENSECSQYVTEKPWLGLKFGLVPIVLGGTSPADYADILPPRSYIHVDDFKSVEELGLYLQYLMSNPAAYNEYHAWREYYEPFVVNSEGDYSRWCHVCDVLAQKKVNNELGQMRTVGDYWFEEDVCKPTRFIRNF